MNINKYKAKRKAAGLHSKYEKKLKTIYLPIKVFFHSPGPFRGHDNFFIPVNKTDALNKEMFSSVFACTSNAI